MLPAFPIITCKICNQKSLLARELDENERWNFFCTRCNAKIEEKYLYAAKAANLAQLQEIGYQVKNVHCTTGCKGSCQN